MSSNRHWNIVRHIQRIHNGVGIPFSRDDSILEVYKEHADQGSTLSPAFLAELSAASLSPGRKQEEHIDLIDRILPNLRKLVEFKNLSREILPHPQGVQITPGRLDGFDATVYGAYRPAFLQTSSFKNGELEILGYRGYTCGICLMNHPLAVYARKDKTGQEAHSQQEQFRIIPTVHQCNDQRAAKYSSLPIETRKTLFGDLLKNLPDIIMTSVRSWTKNQSRLVLFEMPYNVCKNFSLDLFPDGENHWSIRTIKNRQTVFRNDEEMMDFIRSANSSTAGLFNVHSQFQENGYKSTYFVAIVPIYSL